MPDYRIKITHQPTNAETLQEISVERLVRAKNEARAIAHVVKDTVQIERCSADDLIRLTKAGVEIEVAGDAT